MDGQVLSWKILYPFIALILISALPSLFIQRDDNAVGYHFFLLLTTIMYIVLVMFILILQYNGSKRY